MGDGEALLVSTSLQMAPKSWQGASAVVLVMERVGRPAVPPEKKKKKRGDQGILRRLAKLDSSNNSSLAKLTDFLEIKSVSVALLELPSNQ